MKFFKTIFICICLITVSNALSQEVKFGKITKEELKEKECPFDKDAAAVVLYGYRNTYLTSNNGVNRLVTKIHERIKIYNKEGFEYATEYINLFKTRSSLESVSKIKAYTYNLENETIVKTSLEKDQIFKTKLSYNYLQTKFTMPNLKEGSVIEFEYTIRSPFIWNIDDFRFQREIPVKKIEAKIRTPKGFNFKATHKGYLNFQPKRKTEHDSRIGMPMVINSYELANVPALRKEPFVDNIDNYRSGVAFELTSIEIPGVKNRYFSKSWSDVAKSIGGTDDYKNQLDKSRSFDDELDVLLLGKTDELEKLKLLFKYVKENTEWNGIDGKFFQNGLKKTLKERKGNAADVNLLLVAMLRYAGIKANPFVISTKDNAIPFFPTLERLNYVIAHAKIGDKEYYMDATEEFGDINVLPIKDYNWGGLIIDNPNENWKHIFKIDVVKSANRYSLGIDINGDGSIGGKYMAALTNHSAYKFRKRMKDKDIDGRIKEREEECSGIEIEDYKLKNIDSAGGVLSESFSYLTDDAVDVVGDKMYIKPMVFLCIEENPFKLETREFPVDFGFPFINKYRINISIPEGFKVESIPEQAAVALPENMGVFKYMIQNNEDKILLSVTFELNKPVISALNYPFLKEYYNQIIKKQSEQIVLFKS